MVWNLIEKLRGIPELANVRLISNDVLGICARHSLIQFLDPDFKLTITQPELKDMIGSDCIARLSHLHPSWILASAAEFEEAAGVDGAQYQAQADADAGLGGGCTAASV
jgi:hypothetical protein